MAAAGGWSELEWTESWSIGLLSGPGLGLKAEVSQILRVVLVEHRLVGLGLAECLKTWRGIRYKFLFSKLYINGEQVKFVNFIFDKMNIFFNTVQKRTFFLIISLTFPFSLLTKRRPFNDFFSSITTSYIFLTNRSVCLSYITTASIYILIFLPVDYVIIITIHYY